MRDRIVRNALHLLVSTGLTMGLGFAFWWLAARLLEPAEMGLASAVVSAMLLLGVLSKLGFDVTLVRLLQGATADERRRLMNTFLVTTAAAGILFGSAFVVLAAALEMPFAPMLSEPLTIFVFVAGVVGVGVMTLVEGLFLADERADLVAAKNGAASAVKLALLPALAAAGAFGIVAATGATSAAIALAVLFIAARVPAWSWRARFDFDADAVAKSLRLNAGNFCVQIAEIAPTYLLPVLLAHMLSPAEAGYFYVTWLLASALYFIPVATGTSFLASASREPGTTHDRLRRAARLTTLLLLPAMAAALLLGPLALRVVGSAYAENGWQLFVLCVLAAPAVAANGLWTAVLRSRDRPLGFTVFAGGIFVTMITLVVALSRFGLAGVGVAWLAANLLFALRSVPGLARALRREMPRARIPPRAARLPG